MAARSRRPPAGHPLRAAEEPPPPGAELSGGSRRGPRLPQRPLGVPSKGLAKASSPEPDGAVACTQHPVALQLCLVRLQSAYDLAATAGVCRAWRDVLRDDATWSVVLHKWWPGTALESGSSRAAFITRYQQGRARMQEARLAQLEQSVTLAAFGNRGPLINVEAAANNARKLGLRFEVHLHKWRQPVSSPQQSHARALLPASAVTIFPTSVSLRLPPARLSANFTLRGLASLEVVVVSPVLMATEVLMKVNGESIAQGLQPSWPDAPGKAPLNFSFARLWEYSCGTIGIDTSSPCMTGEREAEGESNSQGRDWTDNSMEDDLWAPSSYQTMGQTGALRGSIVLGTLPEKDAASKTLSEQIVLLVVNLNLEHIVQVLRAGSSVRRRLAPCPNASIRSCLITVHLRTFSQIWWLGFHKLESKAKCSQVKEGTLKLPWRTEVFSGAIIGGCIIDCIIWDVSGRIAWSCSQPVRIHLCEAPIVPCAMLHAFSVEQAPLKGREEVMQPAWCSVEDPLADVSVTVEFPVLEADFPEFLTQMQPVTHLKQLQN